MSHLALSVHDGPLRRKHVSFTYLAFVLFFGVPNVLAHRENAGRGRAQC